MTETETETETTPDPEAPAPSEPEPTEAPDTEAAPAAPDGNESARAGRVNTEA